MRIPLGFGKRELLLELPDKNVLQILAPNDLGPAPDEKTEIENALLNPIGTGRLSGIVKPGEKIAVITSDITRPMPSYKVLPFVIRELNMGGILDRDIIIVFALGSHRNHSEEEMRKLVGDEIYERIHCMDSVGEFTHIGTTSGGTPVDVFRPVAEADRRVCLGNIEFHYFAGYSGGAKAVMPGVSTRDAISANHSKMVMEGACAGRIKGNPLREDIDEAGSLISIDFIVNVVLDEKKHIRKCVAGHYINAHREGCEVLDKLYKVSIPRRGDIVIVSAGGYPKDINLYQAQKALDNARHAVRDGGIVIWVASSQEGFGEHVFEEWMKGHDKPADMIGHIRQDFQLGGHKAAAIALVLEKARIMLVSDLSADIVKSIHLEPFSSVQQAVSEALASLGEDASVLVMPYGGSTLPSVIE
ncbi:MAG: nickel-dependent malate racemase, LarAH6 family [Christensenellales bacterium]